MTTKVNGTDNSVSAPAIVGTDTTSGIYFPTTAQVAVSISGTQVALFSSTGLNNATIVNPSITNFTETPYSIGNSGTSQVLSLANGTFQSVTLNGNCTFTMPTATNGKSFILIVTQDATGGRTATFTSVKWPAGSAPTITTTASTGKDILAFFADGTNWYGAIAQAFA